LWVAIHILLLGPVANNFAADSDHGQNKLEIEVVNFWPNRIIGDASLPQDERLTKTNIRNLKATTALMESGLLGPVRILEGQ
jgi:hypothetical protein